MQAPKSIHYDRATRQLTILWPDEVVAVLSAEFLRVHSPSAEVRGHGMGQEVLQTGKQDVAITNIEKTGRYAIKISFDDGHDSGLYHWDYLQRLGEQRDALWQLYLERLQQAGATRQSTFINVTQLS